MFVDQVSLTTLLHSKWEGALNQQVYFERYCLRARSYAGVVFTRFCCLFIRFCHVLKEFPRLRSRYVLVLLFPKQTNFYVVQTTSGSDSTLPCP